MYASHYRLNHVLTTYAMSVLVTYLTSLFNFVRKVQDRNDNKSDPILRFSLTYLKNRQSCVVVPAYNPSIQDAEAGGLQV
jgi:hypothetical protein